MREKDLRAHTALVADALSRYANTEAVNVAYQIGDEILRWAPTWPAARCSFHEKAASLFAMLRNEGIAGRDLVWRVCTLFAFINEHPERFPTRMAEDIALGRGIRRLVTLPHGRPEARTLRTMGEIARGGLGLFALMLLRRMDVDHERARRTFSVEAFDREVSDGRSSSHQ